MKLYRLSQLTTAAAFVLIIAGGLVTSTGSGLAIPDWPLAYGGLVPPWEGGIRFEYSHRVIAGTVAILTLLTTVAIWCARASRLARMLSTAALGAVIMQAILGGMTVLYELPAPVSIIHACLGQVFFALLVSTMLTLSPSWQQTLPQRTDRRLLWLVCLTAVGLFVQLILGAIRRHTGLGLELHVLGALGVTVLIGATCIRAHQRCADLPRVMQLCHMLLSLVPIQILLGVLVAWVSRAVWIQTAHVGIGALLLATSIGLVWRTLRCMGHWQPVGT